jgi:SAM-dependent methyltransferase
MSTLSFAGDMGQLQRAFAESHDAVVRRAIVLDTLNLRTGERVLELGCGGGYYAHDAARFVGPTGRVCAIDVSAAQCAAQRRRTANLDPIDADGDNCARADIGAAPQPAAAAEFRPDPEIRMSHDRSQPRLVACRASNASSSSCR